MCVICSTIIYANQATGGLNTDLLLPRGFETAKHAYSNPLVTHPILRAEGVNLATQETTNQTTSIDQHGRSM